MGTVDPAIQDDLDLEAKVKAYLENKKQADQISKRLDTLKTLIIDYMGADSETRLKDGTVVKVSAPTITNRIDTKALKEHDNKIYQKYLKASRQAPRLTIKGGLDA